MASCFLAMRYSSSLSCVIIQSSSSRSSSRWDWEHWASSAAGAEASGKGPGAGAISLGRDRLGLIRRISVDPVCLNRTEKPTSVIVLPSTASTTNVRNCISGTPSTRIHWNDHEPSTWASSWVKEPAPVDASVWDSSWPSTATFALPQTSSPWNISRRKGLSAIS